ncbi:MAG: DUF4998 domain-containing protein [Dysgonamonadaceae bacterium]|jgi:hypothetical protein|nr:DUF4998 domain-containing protein [Dysgonamonadaceae bacterium]
MKSIFKIIIISGILVRIFTSCDGVYDDIKEFSLKEEVYPAKFDTIFATVGFNRVELDLNKAGRIPASQIKLGKAKKTVITWDDGVGKLEIDSVCSWVNITGLTESRLYRFAVYTEDQYGNRSVPLEIAVTPYTEDDLKKLKLTPPRITESTTAALLEWQEHLSSTFFTMYDYTYEYLDKDNTTHSGGGEGDLPGFFVENVLQGQSVIINITSRILPIYEKKNILDTLLWKAQYELNISENARPAIFLKAPDPLVIIHQQNYSFPLLFEWTATSEVSGYTLKISDDSSFPTLKTLNINVGNTDHYEMSQAEFEAALANYHQKQTPFYWTVVPTVSGVSVRNQLRQFIGEKPRVDGPMFWNCDNITFSYESYLPNFFDTENKMEGTASWSLSTTASIIGYKTLFASSLFPVVDCTPYGINLENGYLVMWLYISDATHFKTRTDSGSMGNNGEFELSSRPSGYDTYELAWSPTQMNLKNGWNEVELAFADAVVEGMPIDLSSVRYIRWYDFGELIHPCTIKLDAIRLARY